MANLNVSNSTVRALGTQQAKQLVNEILTDGKVDKTDKENLKKLETLLTAAAEEDGTLDGEEKELIGALTNHNYILGVNAGTSETYLAQNLTAVKNLQKSAEGEPSEVNFDGLTITTDGLFSDEVRVVRLRDGLPTAPDTGTDNTTNTGTSPTVNETPTTDEGTHTVSTPPTTEENSGNPVTPTPPVNQYVSSEAPTAGPAPTIVAPENAQQLSREVADYNQAVTALQNDVRSVREMLNDPQQVSNAQLEAGIQTLIEKDPARAIQQLARLNGFTNDKQFLELMQQQGKISSKDISTLETYLADPGKFTELPGRLLESGKNTSDAIRAFLKDNPLSEQQLNGYRTSLVSSADNYLTNPSAENQEQLKSELYDNLYVFSEASPQQKAAYNKLSPAISNANQKLENIADRSAILQGEKSALQAESIRSAKDLVNAVNNAQTNPQQTIKDFSENMDGVLSYLKENPGQYAAQAADTAQLESKLQSLSQAQTAQEKLDIINSFGPLLDNVHENTAIVKGAAGVDDQQVLSELEALSENPQTSTATKTAIAFFKEHPELLKNAAQISDYKNILDTLNGTAVLNANQQALKTALEQGDTAAINSLYLNEMMSSFSFGLGGAMSFVSSTINSVTGLNLGNSFTNSLISKANEEVPQRLPGSWLDASALGETLKNLAPEERAQLIADLQSPEAVAAINAMQNDPEVKRIIETYSRAEAASNAIQQGYLRDDSDFDASQLALQNQQNLEPNIQIELNNAKTAIDKALTQGDLAPSVKEKLTAQKAAIDKALTLIEQGKFDDTSAMGEDQKVLDTVLNAIASNDKTPPLDVGLVLQREATIEALKAAATPSNMQKLEEALSGNPNYNHIFAKDGDNYKYPDELTKLLQDDDLSPDALALLLNQTNRAVEVIDSASSRTVETLKANYAQGKKLEEQDGVQRDFYSGFMALESLNTITQKSQDPKLNLTQTEILNSIAGQQDINAVLSNADRGVRREALTNAMRSDAIDSGVTKARQDRLTEYVESTKKFNASESGVLLDNLFGDSEEAKEGRAVLDQHLSKIAPDLDLSKINSREALFRELTPDQLSALQKSIAEMPYGEERAKVEQQRNNLLNEIKGVELDPPYNSQEIYDTSRITDSRVKAAVEQLNSLNRTSGSVNTLNDKIKDIFSSQEITPLLNSRGSIAQNLSQDIRGDIGITIETLDTDINRTPGFKTFLENNPIRARPERNLPNGNLNPNYDNEMMAYANELRDRGRAYLSTLPTEPAGVEHARMDTIIQGAENLNVLSDVALRIDSGADIDLDLQARAHAAMTNTGLLANLSQELATAGSPTAASDAVQRYNSDKQAYRRNLQDAIEGHPGNGSGGGFSAQSTPGSGPEGGPSGPSASDSGGDSSGTPLVVSTQGMSQGGAGVVIQSNLLTTNLAALQQDRIDRRERGEEPERLPPFDEMSTQEVQAIISQRPEGNPSALEMVDDSIERGESIYSNIPPENLIEVGRDIQASMQAYQRSFDSVGESLSKAVDELNVVRASEGLPPLNGGSNARAVSGPPPQSAADQRAAELIDKANALADRLVLAPEGENSEEFLMDLINGFINTIRDQDYKTRQLILAQLANQMMTDSITNFYKDKTDKNNKYHQDSIARMAESFQRNIQRTIQESLVSQASDSQSIAAVSGQVGAANTAEAMGIEQLRASSEQLLSEAQKMTPPLITDLQKEKILESLFDNNPNNDAMGIIALAGLSVN